MRNGRYDGAELSDLGILEIKYAWFKDDQLHREDGPAFEYNDGTKIWYFNGKYHRLDGPAVEWFDGDKFWYLNGKRHREDGPAIEWKSGNKEWYYYGQYIGCRSQKEFERIIKLLSFR